MSNLPRASRTPREVRSPCTFSGRAGRFYSAVAASLALSTPRCFSAEVAPASGDFILLLEDLGNRRLGDQVAGATAAEARLLTTAIAAHHAAYWNDPRLAALDWIPEASSHLNEDGLVPYQVAGPMYIEQHGDELGPATW